jgi:hypothetical protein
VAPDYDDGLAYDAPLYGRMHQHFYHMLPGRVMNAVRALGHCARYGSRAAGVSGEKEPRLTTEALRKTLDRLGVFSARHDPDSRMQTGLGAESAA